MSMSTAVSSSGSARIRSAACEPVELGHADVHQHDVGPPAPHDVHRRAAVGRLADDGDVGLGVEDHAEAGAQEPLVVGDHDGDRRAAASSRRGGASSPSSSRQRTCAAATRSATPAQPQRPGGRISSATRGAGDWRTTSDARISPGAGGVAQAAGDDHRRPVQVAALGERLARVEPDAQPGRGRAGRRRCIATAQRTAATALANATISPSPVDLTSRPPCSATTARSAAKCARAGVGLLVAVRSRAIVEPTTSVNRIVTKARPRRGASSPLRRRVSPQRVSRRAAVHPRDDGGAARRGHAARSATALRKEATRQMMRSMSHAGSRSAGSTSRIAVVAERARRAADVRQRRPTPQVDASWLVASRSSCS